jgi:hypothetical protein
LNAFKTIPNPEELITHNKAATGYNKKYYFEEIIL